MITLSSQQLSEKDKVLIPLFTLITRRYLRTVVIRQQLLDFALITGQYLRESPTTAAWKIFEGSSQVRSLPVESSHSNGTERLSASLGSGLVLFKLFDFLVG